MSRIFDGFTSIVNSTKAIFSASPSETTRKQDSGVCLSREELPEYIKYRRFAYLGQQSDNNATTSSNGSHDATRDDIVEVEEVEVPTRQQTSGDRAKRDRDSVSTEEPARKRSKPSSHEQRLFANYHVPKEAKPLEFNYAGSDWNSRATKEEAVNKAKMGGVKPMNTLGLQKHGGRATAAGNGDTPRPSRLSNGMPGQNQKSQPGKPVQRLATEVSRGSNVHADGYRSGIGGDGFEDAGRTKRRKIEQKATNEPGRTARNSTIDLTAEESQELVDHRFIRQMQDFVEAEVVSAADLPKPEARTHPGSQPSMRPPSLSAQQGQTTMQRAFASNKPPGKRRKPHPSRSSQDSRAASVVSSSGSEQSNKRGSAQKPLDLDDDSQEGRIAGPGPPESRQGAHSRPVIELDKDLDRVKTNREKFEDDGRAGALAPGQLIDDHHPTAQSPQPAKGGLRTPSQIQVAREKKIAYDNARTANSTLSEVLSNQEQQKQEGSPRLSKNFVRDDGGSRQDRPKKARLRESMKGDSSPDELQGGSTVSSRASRSISPVKRGSKEARLLPSNIKPAKLTSTNKVKQKQHVSSADEVPVVVPTAIRLRAFYSKAVCVTVGKSYLLWNAKEKQLELWQDDLPVMVEGKKLHVAVGSSEIASYQWSAGNNRLVISGPMTDISNGKICIAAEDFKATQWLMDYIAQATNDNNIIYGVTNELLNKTFAHQCEELQKAHKIYAARNKRTARLSEQDQRRGSSSDEEQIQYEAEGDQHEGVPTKDFRAGARAGRASAMLAERAARQATTASKYFDPPSGATRRSTRDRKPIITKECTPSPKRWTVENQPKQWSRPVEYPSQGPRRVTVDFSDLERLDEGSFLNDNVISYGMRKIEEEMDPEKRAQVHFFNSFFYTSLTVKNGKKTFNYEGVKKWTKNKDIFSLPYVVVPINIDLHWFVAIICNLDKIERKPPSLEDLSEDEQGPISAGEQPSLRQTTLDTNVNAEEQGSSTRESSAKPTTVGMKKLSITDDVKDEDVKGLTDSANVFAFGSDGKIETEPHGDAGEPNGRPSTAAGRKGKRKSAPPLKKFDVDKPAVITLDSFGSTHSVEVRNLKDYVANEAMEKRGMEVTRDALQGVNAKGIPQQTNFCDCGVYLLGYIEQFAKDPSAFVEKVLSRQLDEQSDFASFDPSAKRAEIRDQLLELNETQEAARKQVKKAKAAEKAAAAAKADGSSETVSRGDAAPIPAMPENVAERRKSLSGASSPRKHMILPTDAPAASIAASSPARKPTHVRAAAKKPGARTLSPEKLRSSAMQQSGPGKVHDNDDDEEEGLDYEAHCPLVTQGSSRPSSRGHDDVNGQSEGEMLDRAEDSSSGEEAVRPKSGRIYHRRLAAAADQTIQHEEQPEEIPDSQEGISAIP